MTSESFDSAFENDVRFKADRQVLGATCFIWDKSSGYAARSKPAGGQASCLLRRRGTRKRKRVDGRRPHANSKSWGIRDRCGVCIDWLPVESFTCLEVSMPGCFIPVVLENCYSAKYVLTVANSNVFKARLSCQLPDFQAL